MLHRHILYLLLILLLAGACRMPVEKPGGLIGETDSLSDTSLLNPLAHDPDMDRIVRYYRKIHSLFDSLERMRNEDRPQEVTRLTLKLANEYREAGSYNEGIQMLKQAMHDVGDTDSISVLQGMIRKNIAAHYYELYHYHPDKPAYLDSSTAYAKTALQLGVNNHDNNLLAGSLNILGGICIRKQHYDSASRLLEQAYQLNQQGFTESYLPVMANLSLAYFEQDKLPQALEMAQQCFVQSSEANNLVFSALSLETIQKIQNAMGDTLAAGKTAETLRKIKQQKDVAVQSLLVRQLSLEHERKANQRTILGLYREQYLLLRLSIVLSILISAGFLALFLLIKWNRQSRKLRQTDQALNLANQLGVELELKNTSLQLKTREAEAKALKADLKAREDALAAKLLTMSHMNEFLVDLRDRLSTTASDPNNETISYGLKALNLQISKQLKNDIWADFELIYSSGKSSFIQQLTKNHPDLTANEKRICYLILMDMSTKEMSHILLKNYRSVEMARHRLRKKFNLDNGGNLTAYLQSFTENSE